MQIIPSQTHDKLTFIYALSKLTERGAYYGIRMLIVLYMIGETLNMPTDQALSLYGVVTLSLVFSQILGAILGDLLLKNKRALIIGSLLQALGTFVLCFNTIESLYTAFILLVLGSGLYTPNIVSHFGKLYLNKTKLLDAGFTLFYVAINIGSFLGIMSIGYIGENFGYNYGFMTAGVLFLLSVLFPILIKEPPVVSPKIKTESLPIRFLHVLAAFAIVGLFWAVYEISGIRIFELQIAFGDLELIDFDRNIITSLNFYFLIPVGILFIVLWTKYFTSQYAKFAVGFILFCMALIVALLIPETPLKEHLYTFIFVIFLLTISELFIAPIVNSVLTQYTNPKYLAIVTSLSYATTRPITFLITYFTNDYLFDNPIVALKISLVITVIISIGLIVFTVLNKRYMQQHSN